MLRDRLPGRRDDLSSRLPVAGQDATAAAGLQSPSCRRVLRRRVLREPCRISAVGQPDEQQLRRADALDAGPLSRRIQRSLYLNGLRRPVRLSIFPVLPRPLSTGGKRSHGAIPFDSTGARCQRSTSSSVAAGATSPRKRSRPPSSRIPFAAVSAPASTPPLPRSRTRRCVKSPRFV